jgi:hypothetical protein
MKYEMQLLLSKVLYESKPKAAIKDIERMIEDIEAYRHTVWLYIFRYQLAMFQLASSNPGEIHGAIVQMQKITNLAKQCGDSPVLAFAAAIEALLHLSSSSHEAVVASQEALAKARALQLNPDVVAIPQLTVMLEFVDIGCSIRDTNIADTERKRKTMHEVIIETTEKDSWRDDGTIFIPVSRKSLMGIQVQANKHVLERNGRHFITFSWLSKVEAEALGFLLSADSSKHKSGADGGKAVRFAEEGLDRVRGWSRPSLSAGDRRQQRVINFQRLLEAEFLLILAFMQCSKGKWEDANESITTAAVIAEDLGDAATVNMRSCLLYLRGIVLQGKGDLNAALKVYQSPLFDLTAQQQARPPGRIAKSHFADSDITRNISIMAAMNAVLIIQNQSHPQHNRLLSQIKGLEPMVNSCGNKHIQAHFSLLISVLSGGTLSQKHYLKTAMEAGKTIGNAQVTALALTYMQERLFRGVVDEQALKCAKAASHQSRRAGDPLWMHVAGGLEAQALEVNGFEGDAGRRKVEAETLFDTLPEAVKKAASA